MTTETLKMELEDSWRCCVRMQKWQAIPAMKQKELSEIISLKWKKFIIVLLEGNNSLL